MTYTATIEIVHMNILLVNLIKIVLQKIPQEVSALIFFICSKMCKNVYCYKNFISGVSLSPPSKYTSSSSNQTCRFYPNCKNLDCRYFHPKKCRYDDECTNPDCKYIHSQKKRPKWSSKS